MVEIDLHGITVRECPTEYGDYTFHFYTKDHRESRVKQEIPQQYTVSHREYEEGGELAIYFIERE